MRTQNRGDIDLHIYNAAGRRLIVPPEWRLNQAEWTLQCGDKIVQLPPSIAYGEISASEFDRVEKAILATTGS
ncbi:MAG: hypothetical protein ACN6OP_25200 [Pseudomonadales bacterium]